MLTTNNNYSMWIYLVWLMIFCCLLFFCYFSFMKVIYNDMFALLEKIFLELRSDLTENYVYWRDLMSWLSHVFMLFFHILFVYLMLKMWCNLVIFTVVSDNDTENNSLSLLMMMSLLQFKFGTLMNMLMQSLCWGAYSKVIDNSYMFSYWYRYNFLVKLNILMQISLFMYYNIPWVGFMLKQFN